MNVVYTDIRLENPVDKVNAITGLIDKSKVRSINVRALVDTGAWNLVINEETCAELGLVITHEDEVELAGGTVTRCGITQPVTVHWRSRSTDCNAVLLPAGDKALLGALPMEGLDLTVNPKREVVGAHGDKVFMFVK